MAEHQKDDTAAPQQLGHVALWVRDVDASVAFYRDVLGLNLKARFQGMAFLGIREDASHELALMPAQADAPGPGSPRAGVYHFAWEMPSFEALQRLHQRLLDKKVRISGYDDNQANVMFYDPDGNELEAVWEPAAEERARMFSAGERPRSLNPAALQNPG